MQIQLTAEIESIARPLASLAALARTVVAGLMVVAMDSDEALTDERVDGEKALAPSAMQAITAP